MYARQICAVVILASVLGQTTRRSEGGPSFVVVGDARLQVRLDYGFDVLAEAEYRVEGKPMKGLRGPVWGARIDGTTCVPSGEVRRTGGDKEGLLDEVSFEGDTESLHWVLNYGKSGPGRVMKTLTFTARRDLRLEQVTLWQASEPAPPVVARAAMQDIAAICRQDGRALFASLDFPYSRIENAFSEIQETWIDLRTGTAAGVPQTMPADVETRITSRPLPARASDAQTGWWLQTRFQFPFMYTIGAEPFFDEHTILVLPLIRQTQAQQVSAWINGKPLNVQLYRYPRNRTLGCYYADLVGSSTVGGENTLVVHLQY